MGDLDTSDQLLVKWHDQVRQRRVVVRILRWILITALLIGSFSCFWRS